MGTRASRLRKAAWMAEVLEAMGLQEDILGSIIPDDERSLASIWDAMIAWLNDNMSVWASQAVMAREIEKRPLSFTSLMGMMRSRAGGSYLRFRQMRQSAEGIRYVISDGSTDFAEVVADAETGEVKSVFPYRVQHLVRLIRAAAEHGVKITE